MTVTDALREAHTLLRKAVPRLRRKAHAEEGQLAAAFREAMVIVDQQKAAGVSQAERLQGLDQVLRAVWPQTREWKYLCERCSDTGWESRICTPEASCGRPFRLPSQRADDYTGQGKCQPGHAYVVPCWCEKGQALRRGLLKQPAPMKPEDFTQAARSKPSRVGR